MSKFISEDWFWEKTRILTAGTSGYSSWKRVGKFLFVILGFTLCLLVLHTTARAERNFDLMAEIQSWGLELEVPPVEDPEHSLEDKKKIEQAVVEQQLIRSQESVKPETPPINDPQEQLLSAKSSYGMIEGGRATIRALLIGIDEYKAPHISDLRGCENDVELMRATLIDKFNVPAANIALLKNEQATRDGIIGAIKDHLINSSQPGDIVILHYSGHGSQMVDSSGDEIDGFDETLVAHDSRTEGVFDISDDEINGLLKLLTEKTKNVTFIFDSCHSGSAARGGNAVRMIEADNRPPPAAESFAISTRGNGDGEADFRPNDSDYVLISGCRATELSNEATFAGRRHGVMTWFLSQALRGASSQSTYKSVMEQAAAEATSRYPSQHPQIEGPGIDLAVFGSDRISTRPSVLVEDVSGNSVSVGGGKMYGLASGSILDVYPPGSTDFGSMEPSGRIKVTEAKDYTANGVIEEGGRVAVLSKAVPRSLRFGESSVPIFLQKDDTTNTIREALTDYAVIKLVENTENARFIVRREDNTITIRGGDLESMAAPVSAKETGYASKVVEQVKGLAHWASVLDLINSQGAIQIQFDIRRMDDPVDTPTPQVVTPGTKLKYRVHNLDDIPLYIYVLDVSSDGSVALLYPRVSGAEEVLPAGQVLEKRIETFLPEGHGAVIDVFKVIATSKPIDPRVFPQGAITRAAVAGAENPPQDQLSQFFFNSLRGKRGAMPDEEKTWVTTQQSLTIRPAGARFSGFSVHFDKAAEQQDLPKSFGLSRSVCNGEDSGGSNDCFQVVRSAADGTSIDLLQSQATRGEAENVKSVGQAFEEAYQILDQMPEALRVEPLLEVDNPEPTDQMGIEKRDVSGDDSHDELARNDDQWHIKQIRAAEAWAKIRAQNGADEGKEAAGIFIAHIDTGYQMHPETWLESGADSPVEPSSGHDYFDGDDDPLDPLLSGRKLDNPGHGTAAGSVIVSPPGCQLEGMGGCVNGIARGAKLIPLRVNRTVSQLNTANLTRAIHDVAAGTIQRKPKLVSIAMGGPPTFSMWKAVKSAEKNGVLVVSAAGNYVRTVVWPARFRSTIAVAASNVRCQPWKNSSNGSKVDISSPGESVWRASFNKEHEYINGMGKGTTFATGNTSGAAGLWLAYHSDNPELLALQQQGLLTQAFRQALRASSWRPDDTDTIPEQTHCDSDAWDESNYGPGIIDITALLDVPLTGLVAQSRGDVGELPDLPLFSSLYPEDTAPEKIRADYQALYGDKRTDNSAKLNTFETEIMYHYTVNADVQQSIDGLVAGQRGGEPIERVRRALLRQDLSKRLRAELR